MNTYRQIASLLRDADAVLIGASNGLSISEGLHIFADNAWFRENFGDFRAKYGLRNLLDGMFCRYESPEESWAFHGRLIRLKCIDEKPSRMMLELYSLVKDKPHYVVTSNGEDHFAPAGFAPKNVFAIEGMFTRSRCADGCGAPSWDNRDAVRRMGDAVFESRVPTDLLPRCPHCGAPAATSSDAMQSLFQSEEWQAQQRDYQDFVRRAHGKKLLILEFGIGWRNQLIKAPLMQLAAAEPNANYVTFNKGELYIPDEIAAKSIGVDGDIAEAIHGIAEAMAQ